MCSSESCYPSGRGRVIPGVWDLNMQQLKVKVKQGLNMPKAACRLFTGLSQGGRLCCQSVYFVYYKRLSVWGWMKLVKSILQKAMEVFRTCGYYKSKYFCTHIPPVNPSAKSTESHGHHEQICPSDLAGGVREEEGGREKEREGERKGKKRKGWR